MYMLQVKGDFDSVVAQVTAALEAAGFGVERSFDLRNALGGAARNNFSIFMIRPSFNSPCHPLVRRRLIPPRTLMVEGDDRATVLRLLDPQFSSPYYGEVERVDQDCAAAMIAAVAEAVQQQAA